ncbi:type II toxin-antitoxin system MqsA family antitoxin [Sulfurisoma sediminicola]|uniref:HTH-type transcriptional regulator/antitoxin MqsA n=1 Tax=Sulfurisoma sediminicola TaxID=1381557 RepID=A0A497XJ07_9PROT|nr:type II toxin-antitoxin system MqsA family antitoxin [Sulfurisoma sediminicola]RLJ67844.1 HTH-type transcriptional regulator/antitoxin MqsA [Sulfurisoma sediminicola]
MPRECLNCGQEKLRHAVKDVPYEYKGHATVVPKVAGWHCSHCHEVEFDPGEGKRFAEAIKRIATEIDAQEAAELARIRKKLKLTQLEAARITGGGPNAFSRYERGKARPLPAVTNLFRLLDRHPELLNELQN